MITVYDFFDYLAHGELHNFKMGNSTLESITPEHYPRVISALNLALMEVHKRLDLRRKTLTLYQHASTETYYLRSAHVTDSADALDDETYILETTANPFQDDVAKVMEIVDSDGDDVRLDDARYPADFFTQAHDTLLKSAPATTIINQDGGTREAVDVFTLKYRANHPKLIITETFKPTKTYIYVPEAVLEPLLIYTTYKMLRKPAKIAKGEINPANSLLIEFENAIRRVKDSGLDLTPVEVNTNFKRNGWV